jgi:hypothetical protein
VGDFAIFIWMEKLSPRFKRHICLLLIVLPVLVVWVGYYMEENEVYRLPKPVLELMWYANLFDGRSRMVRLPVLEYPRV